ncbi:MAG: TolC family protein [Pseudomonadota bacterium]|nr:TolC family protein [Pseudomonadota bacterium]
MRQFLSAANLGSLILAAVPLWLAPGTAHGASAAYCSEGGAAPCAERLALWREFAGGEASRLIERGLEANTDILVAVARLDAARAQVRIAGGRLSPTLGLNGAGSGTLAASGASPLQTVQSASGQVALAYEVDLFGAIRKGQRAAREEMRSAQFTADAVALAVCAQILETYVRISALEAQANMLSEQVDAVLALKTVIDRRSAEHESSAVERGLIAQQLSSLYAEQANLAELRAQYATNLAVLLGQDMGEGGALERNEVVAFDTISLRAIASEQPLARLDERPDILAAQAALRAAQINAEAVKAAQKPGLRITASGLLGVVSGGIAALANLTTSLAANLFEGGAITGRNEQAEANARLALARYDQTRITAAGEAISALVGLAAARSRETAWQNALSPISRAAQNANYAYLDGDLPFNLVIDTRRNAIITRRALIEARESRLLAQIDVMRAMGAQPAWAGPPPVW